jgi:hypothetical protein
MRVLTIVGSSEWTQNLEFEDILNRVKLKFFEFQIILNKILKVYPILFVCQIDEILHSGQTSHQVVLYPELNLDEDMILRLNALPHMVAMPLSLNSIDSTKSFDLVISHNNPFGNIWCVLLFVMGSP